MEEKRSYKSSLPFFPLFYQNNITKQTQQPGSIPHQHIGMDQNTTMILHGR